VRALRKTAFTRLVQFRKTAIKKVGAANPFVSPLCLVYKPTPLEWNASNIALLTALWTKGHGAGQIADRPVARRRKFSVQIVAAKFIRFCPVGKM
jgi:hypothetical protein